MHDEKLEAEIDVALRETVEATNEQDSRAAFKRMCDLIALRSPQQVYRMEKAQGLR